MTCAAEDRTGAATAAVADFVAARRAELAGTGIDAALDVLEGLVRGGKYLRSSFMYLGWLCGARPSPAAVRAAASLELLHAFALLQDDVMDQSARRRGRPAAHLQLAQWHRERRMSGSAGRFGESAATLLGDLCLIWSEQMLRESGIQQFRLHRVWPHYDAMRTELVVGQFADLTGDLRALPSLEAVLEVARRKSGNYTVRRPLEIGARMAGCDEAVVAQLGRYGTAVGEAFALRDDVLGVFGAPERTGKPDGADLIERKATTVVVAAYQLADAPIRGQFDELIAAEQLDGAALERWRRLIVATGATEEIECMISDRVDYARKLVGDIALDERVRDGLVGMATACAERSA